MGQGAGIQAAETLAKAGVSVVLTGFVGPKAFQALRAAGIQIVQDMEGMSARQAVERFLAGQVKPAEAPNRQGRGR
jgi:predicted Fe-Mo cluster-binding NifX family protein